MIIESPETRLNKHRKNVVTSFFVGSAIYAIGIILAFAENHNCDKRSVAGFNLSNFPAYFYVESIAGGALSYISIDKSYIIFLMTIKFIFAFFDSALLFVFFTRNIECLSGDYSHTAGFLMFEAILNLITISITPTVCAIQLIDAFTSTQNSNPNFENNVNQVINNVEQVSSENAQHQPEVVIRGYDTHIQPPMYE
jgi:hypothetical protein